MRKADLGKVGDPATPRPGVQIGVAIERGRLVVEPQSRPRHTLDELLAQCNPKAGRTGEDREWVDSRQAGAEILP
jgi:antitoxin ChpS